MCLNTVLTKKHKHNCIGYKVFIDDDNDWYKGPFYGSAMKLGKWYQSRTKSFSPFYGRNKYLLGYHIFVSKRAAIRYAKDRYRGVVAKVQFNKIHAHGLQSNDGYDSKAIVAGRMKILEILKRN